MAGVVASKRDGARPIDNRPTEFRIGCSGWYYRHWHGPFYPAELPSHRWFAHYSRAFNTVELNAPFYRWPTPQTVKRWRRDAHRNFVYCIKVNGLITHDKRFVGVKRLIRDFCQLGETLGPHMGAFLFQTPPSFRYSPGKLGRILDQLDTRWTNVLEFRHRDWWNEDALAAVRAASAATPAGIVFCTTSGPRLPDALVRTAPDIYVRFHGPKRWYRHDYSRAELEPWAADLRASGARRVYAYFNNDRDANAIKNARALRRLVRVPTREDAP